MPPLKLIFVGEGREGDCLWIQLDGDAESLSAEALKRAFPDLLGSAAVVRGFEAASEVSLPVVQMLMGSSTVCIAESRCGTSIYSRDQKIHQELVERFKACLPER
jgi:hypothetical protein